MRCQYAYENPLHGANVLFCFIDNKYCVNQRKCQERDNYFKNTQMSVNCPKKAGKENDTI